MAKKRLFFLMSALLLMLAFFGIYWYYLAPPDDFPGDAAIKARLARADVETIQDVIHLDDRHVFVPFITEGGSYGGSLWEWGKHEWQLVAFETDMMPRVWHIDEKDPSKAYFLWNIHPDNKIESLVFFVIKDRNYSITEEVHHYGPKIQLGQGFDLDGKTPYGMLKMPEKWAGLAQLEKNMQKGQNPSLFSFDYFQPPTLQFGWTAIDKNGDYKFPTYPEMNGYGEGGAATNPMLFLNKEAID